MLYRLKLLLYIIVTICLLIGKKPTVNSAKQHNLQIIH